jgi:outer membrane protein assembly factor BamB
MRKIQMDSQYLCGILLILGVLSTQAVAGDWPQFLGPERNGLSTETGLLNEWPEGGPKIVWRVPGGVGMSGVSVSEDMAATLVQREGRQWLLAVSATTGRELWKTDLTEEYKNSMGDGPRGTPAITSSQVFAFTGDGQIFAVDRKSGKVQWSHHVVKEQGAKEADYGMASSPLVMGGIVVVTPGASMGSLVALDCATGRTVWTAGEETAGYSSPVVRTFAGKAQIVSSTGSSVLGIDPEDGRILWRLPFETNYECNIAVPLEVDGRLFVSAGEDHGSVLMDLKADGDKYSLKTVWESLGNRSVLRSEWQTAVLVDKFLYGMDNVGGAGPVTHLTCIDPETGKRQWQVPRFGKGNLIAADGKLFMTTMKGELVIARANPKEYTEIGRMTCIETTRQAPSLQDGMLYIRDDSEIVCIDVRQK